MTASYRTRARRLPSRRGQSASLTDGVGGGRRAEGQGRAESGFAGSAYTRPQARSYDAAQTDRLTGAWAPGGADVNRLIGLSSPLLRARVRDLVRNFPPFARAVNGIVAFTVGKGARFQSLALNPDGTPNHKARKKIEDRFRAWMDKADITGKLHFYELQQLSKRQECENGEHLGRFAAPRQRGRHPVAVQMLEPECLSAWRTSEQAPDTEILNGVEYDVYTGEPVAYHLQTAFGWQRQYETWREPAENVLHGFATQRAGQLRGVTPFAPAIVLAKDMDDFLDAELSSAKLAAKRLALVTTPDPAMFQMTRGLGANQAENALKRGVDFLENAFTEFLRPGEAVTFANDSNRPGDACERFIRIALRMTGITIDLPYEILSGDYTGINYSTSKASRNDFSMFLVPHQFRNEQHFVRPIYHRWLDYEALTQDYLPGYWQNPERYRKAMWIPAGMPSVDPLRDGKADIDKVAAGLAAPQLVILGAGQDPEETVYLRKQWMDMCAAAGVDASTGGVSTALAGNPAKLGAEEQLAPVSADPDRDGGWIPQQRQEVLHAR